MKAHTLAPDLATGIKDGDLKAKLVGGFNGTEAQIFPVTEKGQNILGQFVSFVTCKRSALLSV